MGSRVQVILDDEDREAFRRQALREGKSLSAWLRDAGRRRLADLEEPAIRTVQDLTAFFAAAPDASSEDPEPDWEEHLAVIEESRRPGRTPT